MSEQFERPARPLGFAFCTMFCAALLVALAWSEAYAQSVRIVALGASNTAGYGVGKSAAWPARSPLPVVRLYAAAPDL